MKLLIVGITINETSLCSVKVFTIGLVRRTFNPFCKHSRAILKWVSTGVKITAKSHDFINWIAFL